MSTATTKLPTLAELRERATKLGIDISHLGRKKKEIKALLDAEVAKAATAALGAATTGHLDYQSALNSETKPKKSPPVTSVTSLFGELKSTPKKRRLPKKKDHFGPSKYFGGSRKAEKDSIESFLSAKSAKKAAPVAPKKRVPVPKGMTRVTNPEGYDPNKPSQRPKGLTGPRTMKCGHSEWWWDKDLNRCTQCFGGGRSKLRAGR